VRKLAGRWVWCVRGWAGCGWGCARWEGNSSQAECPEALGEKGCVCLPVQPNQWGERR